MQGVETRLPKECVQGMTIGSYLAWLIAGELQWLATVSHDGSYAIVPLVVEFHVVGRIDSVLLAGWWEFEVLPEGIESDTGPFENLILFLIGLYLIYDGFGKWKTKRLMEDTPTEKIRSVAAGRTELEGVVHSDETTLPAPFTDEECVYVEWKVEVYDYTHTYSEDGGTDKYDIVAEGSRAVPFYLEDGTGRILVAADDESLTAEVSTDNTHQITVGTGDSPPETVEQFIEAHDSQYENAGSLSNPIGFVKSRYKKIGHSKQARRYTQRVIPEGGEVYVLGKAVPREDGTVNDGQEDLLKITRDDASDRFLLSDHGETELESHLERRTIVEIIFGLAFSTGALAALLGVI